jgi:hypothetical protein
MAFNIWMAETASTRDMREPGIRWRASTILATAVIFGSIGVIGWAAGSIVGANSDQAAVEPSSQSSVPSSIQSADATALPSHDEYVAAVIKSQTADGSAGDAQNSGWQNGRDWLATGSPAALAGNPNPAQRGDRLVTAAPAESDSVVPETADLRTIEPYPAEPLRQSKRFRREHKSEQAHAAPAAKFHRLASRATFLEKTVEQGDSGQVSFRYRRRNCTPPNMVDVCFMPAENRRKIVVEQY